MKPKIKSLLKIVSCLILFCFPIIAMAQPAPPCNDPNGCPIDGGLTFLIAAGIGYGIKKVRDNRIRQEKM